MNTKIPAIRLRIDMSLIVLLVLYLGATPAHAVPSFARQTNLPCQSCHTVYPELTPFGRSFKMHGYTMTNVKQVEAENDALKIDQSPPISAMLQISATHAKTETPSTNIDLPDQLSLFYAGEISSNMGSFIQITMEGSTGTFAMDNTDIRYADQAGAVTYGATLNNNPTVQDVWNSTQAWGYPFTHGAEVTTPMINTLGGVVAGLGGYADWGNGFYTELTLYHDTGTFDAQDSGLASSAITDARVNGLAPYWRLAWENTFHSGDKLMLGTYGMKTTLYELDSTSPDPSVSGPHDQYTDVAVDTQYEHTMGNGKDSISVHATYTNEDQTLDYSSPGDNPTLKSTRLDGTYHWGNKAACTLAYNYNTGGNDSAYDDTAWTAQMSYLPWQNTKLTLQYVAYTKLAGSTDAVSDNNTTLLQGWFMW
jgi:hypothetical protein